MEMCYYREGSPTECIIQHECDNGYPLPVSTRDAIRSDTGNQCSLVDCYGEMANCRAFTTWTAACSFGVCVAVDPRVQSF
jgi:hypothetical protein